MPHTNALSDGGRFSTAENMSITAVYNRELLLLFIILYLSRLVKGIFRAVQTFNIDKIAANSVYAYIPEHY